MLRIHDEGSGSEVFFQKEEEEESGEAKDNCSLLGKMVS